MGLLDNLRNTVVVSDSGGPSDASFAPAWRWENAGDGVEGVVVNVDKRVNDNHPEGYPIITLRQQNGDDIAVHGFATVLMNEIQDRNLRVGDTFAAIYDGKKTSSNGRQFHAFRVATEPGNGQVPPAKVAPATAAPARPAAAVANDPWSSSAGSDEPPF